MSDGTTTDATGSDWWGPLVTAAVKGFSGGQGAGGPMQSVGPSTADSWFGTPTAFDNAGWNLNFGSGRIAAPATKSTSQSGASPLGSGSDPMTIGLLFVGAMVLITIVRGRRR